MAFFYLPYMIWHGEPNQRSLWVNFGPWFGVSLVQNIPGETLLLKNSRPLRISSSCSNGMSPHTMSYSRTPRDQMVAERPWYLW